MTRVAHLRPLAAWTAAALVCAMLAALPSSAYTRPGRTSQLDDQGKVPDGQAIYTSISDNGRYVAFDTNAALLPSDTNNSSDVYLRDTKTNKLTLVSVGRDGKAAKTLLPLNVLNDLCRSGRGQWAVTSIPTSWDPAISGNGRYVAFTSLATNLVERDLNIAPDVFVFDRITKKVERVSVNSDEEETKLNVEAQEAHVSCPGSYGPSMDRTGRRVTFTSEATNLVRNDRNIAFDVFVRDRSKGQTRRVSVPANGLPDKDVDCAVKLAGQQLVCFAPGADFSSISGNGRFVAFASGAANLVRNDTNHASDVFVRDLVKDKTHLVSVDSSGRQVGGGLMATLGGDDSQTGEFVALAQHVISANGRYVVFYSSAEDVVPNDSIGGGDFFVHDRQSGRTDRVSVLSSGRDLGRLLTWEVPSLSANGRYVSFSAYSDLMTEPPKGIPRGTAGFVYDRTTGELEITSRTNKGEFGNGCRVLLPDGYAPERYTSVMRTDISGDGRFVTFSSCNTNMQDRPDKPHLSHAILRARGGPLGAGRLASSGALRVAGATSFGTTGVAAITDALGDSDSRTADVQGLQIAYRQRLRDLFVKLDVSRLQRIGTDADTPGAADVPSVLGAVPLVVYGVRLHVDDLWYELRADPTSLLRDGDVRFSLSACSSSSASSCRQIGEVKGGYGTTGESVVFAVPLRDLGLQHGGDIAGVEAFTALGTDLSGALKVLDTTTISTPEGDAR
jgi:hypothetical protein